MSALTTTLAPPTAYTQAVLIAIGDAVTAVSTDATTKTINFRSDEIVRACLAYAAMMMNADPETGPLRGTPGEIAVHVIDLFTAYLGRLGTVAPHAALDAATPGTVSHILA